jgi:heterotetrameric sarcosine oxidase delta subunit
VSVGIKIPCPHCGPRDDSEFTFGGELRPLVATDPAEDFERVYLRRNAAGRQEERWFHVSGCKRWLTLARDTETNRFDPGAG